MPNGPNHKLSLSARILGELDRLFDQKFAAQGGLCPDSADGPQASKLMDLAGRRRSTNSRYVQNLGDFDYATNLALRDCLKVVLRLCVHAQVKKAVSKKIVEIEDYLGISAIDRLGDLVRDVA